VILSKIMKPTTNRTTPSNAKTTAAMKFEPRLSKTVMSFSPPEGGPQVHVVRAIRARVVAHGARDVFDLGHARRSPPSPLGGRRGGENHQAENEIKSLVHPHSLSSSSESDDVVTQGWSLSRHRLYSKFIALRPANTTGTASSAS